MKVQIKGWIAMGVPSFQGDPAQITFFSYKPSGEYYVPVCEHSMEVEIPDDFDYRGPAIEALKQEVQNIRAEAQVKVSEIEDRIGKLLAIEFSGNTVDAA